MIHMLDSLLLLFSHYVLLLWNITHSLFIFRRTSPDINYFYDGAVELNFCTLENGRFFNCVYSTKYATISKPEDDEYEIVPLRFDIQGFTSLGLTLCFFSLLQTPISISCRTSPDINYFNDENVELNFCSLENGRFSNCVYNTDTPGPAPSTINNNRPTVSSPTTIYAPTYGTSPTNSSVNVQYGGSNGDDDGSGGLAGWAIFLIVSLELVILCCVGYCTFLFVSRTDVMMMVILRRKFIKTFTSAMTRV
mmetsp:Transcript_5383/g.8465  ORF Transcript_5383/g.8465 Transcript_5383/m.8465 type:complete len:250 (+) Transcript_5383:3-752(+)